MLTWSQHLLSGHIMDSHGLIVPGWLVCHTWKKNIHRSYLALTEMASFYWDWPFPDLPSPPLVDIGRLIKATGPYWDTVEITGSSRDLRSHHSIVPKAPRED
ncbi:Hypothetical predicted protein [Podarcis lilfordi]|uniref:Uncharacterized protein n=1 Tax=Podarcis lilfordi TaxID=74358 RepID=A0AA35L6N0_9SAUR|nr:Hypothetical predicted protein [Podarcis lilfordi]